MYSVHDAENVYMFSPDVLLTLLIFQQNEHKWGKLIIILLCLKYRAVLRQKEKRFKHKSLL